LVWLEETIQIRLLSQGFIFKLAVKNGKVDVSLTKLIIPISKE
jgi:hypothetical protein